MEQFIRQTEQLIHCVFGNISHIRRIVEDGRTEQLVEQLIHPRPLEFTESCLMEACVFGNITHVRRIVEDGRTDLNGRDLYGMTPIARAYLENNNDIVRYMASEPRVDLSIPDVDGTTIFQAACSRGDADMMDYLIRNASPWSRVPALWRGG